MRAAGKINIPQKKFPDELDESSSPENSEADIVGLSKKCVKRPASQSKEMAPGKRAKLDKHLWYLFNINTLLSYEMFILQKEVKPFSSSEDSDSDSENDGTQILKEKAKPVTKKPVALKKGKQKPKSSSSEDSEDNAMQTTKEKAKPVVKGSVPVALLKPKLKVKSSSSDDSASDVPASKKMVTESKPAVQPKIVSKSTQTSSSEDSEDDGTQIFKEKANQSQRRESRSRSPRLLKTLRIMLCRLPRKGKASCEGVCAGCSIETEAENKVCVKGCYFGQDKQVASRAEQPSSYDDSEQLDKTSKAVIQASKHSITDVRTASKKSILQKKLDKLDESSSSEDSEADTVGLSKKSVKRPASELQKIAPSKQAKLDPSQTGRRSQPFAESLLPSKMLTSALETTIIRRVEMLGFRHEKTKKKRGSYAGGKISQEINSIKFDD
uniref:Srp40 C-terminal domain-containing protein n=1 Tax=Ditylenchus dipsaci TaxID=166011 RepID=A0A915DZR1_9BILA